VKLDVPPLSSVETCSSLLPRRSSTVTTVTVYSALPPETMAMVSSATEHVQSSIPQVNLLVPDVLPFRPSKITFQMGQMKLPILVDSAIFSLGCVKPLSQPILSLDQGLATLVVDVEATHTVEAVILPSWSHEESDLVFVRDLPWDELSGVITPVLRPNSVTSTVPDGMSLCRHVSCPVSSVPPQIGQMLCPLNFAIKSSR